MSFLPGSPRNVTRERTNSIVSLLSSGLQDGDRSPLAKEFSEGTPSNKNQLQYQILSKLSNGQKSMVLMLQRIEAQLHLMAKDAEELRSDVHESFDRIEREVLNRHRYQSSGFVSSIAQPDRNEEVIDLDELSSSFSPREDLNSESGRAKRPPTVASEGDMMTKNKSVTSPALKWKMSRWKARGSMDKGGMTSWPQELSMREGLEETEQERLAFATMMDTALAEASGSHSLMALKLLNQQENSAKEAVREWCARFATWRCGKIHPKAFNPEDILLLDLLSFVCLFYDLVVTPYHLAWDVPLEGFSRISAVWIAAFWVVDFMLQFFTGYYKDGDLVVDLNRVARRYLRTWFLMDFLVIVGDWAAIGLSYQTGKASVNHPILRIAKLCRVLKLLRVARVSRLLSQVSAWSLTDFSRVLMQIMEIILGMFLMNHYLCCGWYALGDHLKNSQDRVWLDVATDTIGVTDFDTLSPAFQYVISLYWMTAQVTMANCPLVVNNIYEGMSGIVLLIYGLLFVGTIVSFFSSHAMQSVMIRHEKIHQLAKLRLFLRQRHISKNIVARVQRQANYRLAVNGPLQEKDVPALQGLSLTLRQALVYECRTPYMCKHPLFKLWQQTDPENLQSLCEVVNFSFFSPHDVVFLPLTDGKASLHVVRGRLNYVQEPGSSVVPEVVSEFATSGAWICEAALWSHWIHVGSLMAVTQSELLQVDAEKLLEVAQCSITVSRVVKCYGRNFYLRIAMAVPPFSTWPSDLHVPYTDPSDLMANDVGIGLLKRAQARGQLRVSDEETTQLVQELLREECAIQETAQGTLERIVAVVALRLERDDGKILVSLGKRQKDGRISAKCVLPGTKRSRGELPSKVLEDQVLGMLWPLRDGVSLARVTYDVTVGLGQYGIYTKYLRTVHQGSMTPGFLPPSGWVEVPCRCYSTEAPISQPGGVPPAFQVIGDAKNTLFAWLTADEFAYYSGQGGASELSEWLSSLELTPVTDWPRQETGDTTFTYTDIAARVNVSPSGGTLSPAIIEKI